MTRLGARAPVATPRPFELETRPFADQIGRGLAAAIRQQGGTVTLRLEPDALGSLKIRMDLDAGRVEATLEASSDRARRLLDDALPALRSALEAHGLSVDRLEVLGGPSPNGPSLRDGTGAEGQDSPVHTGPGLDGGPAGGSEEGAAGSEHPMGETRRPEGFGRAEMMMAEPMWTPEGLGVGAGGALVCLRLDTVA
jgi:Flagellar hook-length control protein FliK